jgi:hypothetical protein
MLTQSNVPYYLRFIERYASLGYAIAFSETGDFFEAQAVLERAFAEGYPTWVGRFARNRDTEDTLRKILRRQLPAEAAPARPLSPASFASSRKLKEVQEAQDILVSFPAQDMIAIFVEVVEELPRDRVIRLLGRPVEYFEEIHDQLAKRLQQWRPGDPQAVETFARLLRQYRLPPSFLTTIEGKIDYSWRRTFSPTATVRNVLIAIGVAVVIIVAGGDRPGYRRFDRIPGDAFGMQLTGGNTLLWIDLMLLASIMALKRGLERQEGDGQLMAGDFENPLSSLPVVHTFGVILVTAGIVHFVAPSTFVESWVPIAYVAAHALYLPLAAAGIMRVFLRIMLTREARS